MVLKIVNYSESPRLSTVDIYGNTNLIITNVASLRLTEPSYNGQIITLLGHTTAGIGGGDFRADLSDTTTADDNGLTIVTSGGKRWKRILETGTVTPEMFGALGDGSADDAPAFKKAIESQVGKVVFDATKTYKMATDTVVVDKNVLIDFNNAKLQISGNTNLLQATANITDVYSVISYNNNVTLDLNDITGSVDSEVAEIFISNTSNYKVNDFVKIVSDDLIPSEDTNELRKIGELARVSEVGTGYIKTYARLKNNYATNTRIGRVNPNNYIFHAENLKILGQQNPNSSWSKAYLNIIGYVNPVLKNVTGENLVERCVRFLSCYKPYTENINAFTVRTDFANDAFGYTIQEVCCESGVHVAPQGINVRSVYTCSAAEPQNLGNLLDYGQTYFSRVIGGYGKNNTAYSFSTHADAVGVQFHGCIVDSGYWGKHGGAFGIGLRGLNCKAIGCTVYGGNGYRAYNDFSSELNSKNHEFIDCTYIYNPNESNEKRAFSVIGQSGAPVKGITINNPIIEHAGDNPIFEVNFGEMRINNLTIRSKYSGTNTARFFEVNDDSSFIKVKGGNIDLTGSTGTGLRFARFVGGNSDADSTSGLIDIRDIDIVADNKLAYLADLRSKTATFNAFNINTTHKPTGDTEGLINESNATCRVDWIENDGVTGTLAHFAGGAFTGGNQSINIGNRFADHLYARILVGTANTTITSIGSGLKLGQKLTIYLRSDSTFNLIISGTATNVDIGANETIDAGKSITLMWANSNSSNKWVKV